MFLGKLRSKLMSETKDNLDKGRIIHKLAMK
jgi:hypothetical protein